MEYRIRLIKANYDELDGKEEFSMEATCYSPELDVALKDMFNSLSKFNAEMAKQGRCCEGEGTPVKMMNDEEAEAFVRKEFNKVLGLDGFVLCKDDDCGGLKILEDNRKKK